MAVAPDINREQTVKPIIDDDKFSLDRLSGITGERFSLDALAGIPPPEKGIVAKTLAAVPGGLVDVADLYGRAVRALDPAGGVEIARGIGTGLVEAAEGLKERHPFLQPAEGAVPEGVRSFVTSVAARVPGVVVGALAGAPKAGIGALPGALAGYATFGPAIFGLAEYDRFREEAKAAGVPDDIAYSQAVKAGFLEGGLEVASDIIGFKLLGLIGKGPADAIKKNLIRRYITNVAKIAAVEIPTEIAQEAGGAMLREDVGIPTLAPMEAAKAVIAPTAVASLLFGALGTGVQAYRARQVMPRVDLTKEPPDRPTTPPGPPVEVPPDVTPEVTPEVTPPVTPAEMVIPEPLRADIAQRQVEEEAKLEQKIAERPASLVEQAELALEELKKERIEVEKKLPKATNILQIVSEAKPTEFNIVSYRLNEILRKPGFLRTAEDKIFLRNAFLKKDSPFGKETPPEVKIEIISAIEGRPPISPAEDRPVTPSPAEQAIEAEQAEVRREPLIQDLPVEPAKAEERARQLPMEERIAEAVIPKELMEERKAEAVTPKEVWQMTFAEYNKAVEAGYRKRGVIPYHKTEVAKAISEGKSVPPEVLKDYPDLQKQFQKSSHSPDRDSDKKRLKIPICYVCGKKAIKEKMQYVGGDKWRCKKCFAGSKSWQKSDVGRKSILSKYFESTVAAEDKPYKKGGEKEMKMYVREDKEKHLWTWYTYPDGQRIDSISVSPAEYIGYDEPVRKEVSAGLAAALRSAVDIQGKQMYKDKPNVLIYTFVVNQKKKEEGIKMAEKKKIVKVEATEKKKKQKDVKEEKKKVGVGELVRKMIKNKNTYEEIEGAVRKEFPESKFNKAHYYWYRKNM